VFLAVYLTETDESAKLADFLPERIAEGTFTVSYGAREWENAE
jgi:hypothetical protein